jgi:hypothetical protein
MDTEEAPDDVRFSFTKLREDPRHPVNWAVALA